jgi:hypothetical protein
MKRVEAAGPTEPAPLHVHGGDCAAAVAERAPLPGRVLAWRDSSAVGPCAVDPAAHRRLRAGWWGVPEESIQLARDLKHEGEIILWFGPDPWEQMGLVEILGGGASDDPISLVDVGGPVGTMAPDDLVPLLGRRRDARAFRPDLEALWRDFCADDRPALHAWIKRLAREPSLRHLGPALTRVLEDREHRRTMRQVEALLARGVHGLPGLMAALARLEDPSHGVWYGDEIVRRVRDQLLAGRP